MTKLGIRLQNNRVKITAQEMPTPEEARRLWKEGKTIDDFREERRLQRKKEKKKVA